MSDNKPISVDKATLELYEKAKKDGVNTVFDRALDMKPCPIGAEGSCCKNCSMGPCRVPLPKKEGSEQKVGLCGATAATIAARNFCRMIAGGCAAHSDHGRGIVETFLLAAKGQIPNYKNKMIAGFSHETINYLLGGSFRASYKPLNDNIINGRIRGIAGVVGCNNARTTSDSHHLILIKELIKNDVIVLTTGCSAIAAAKIGLLTPEAAYEYAGPGLREVCETVGIPPILHMGSCVDNSRILMAATAVVKDGGLGDDISDLPAAGAAPEWMSEKAIAIGQYFVASGVYTLFSGSESFPVLGSKEVTKHLFEDMEQIYGGKWDFVNDPIEMAGKMIAHIDKKRKALGIDKARERVLFDMEARRELV